MPTERTIESFFKPSSSSLKRKLPQNEAVELEKMELSSFSSSAHKVARVPECEAAVHPFFQPKQKREEKKGEKKEKNDDEEEKETELIPSSSSSSSSEGRPQRPVHWSSSLSPLIPPSWRSHLSSEFFKPYFQSLSRSLCDAETKKKSKIFPPPPQIFSAFDRTPFDQVRVVILGQDPYHDDNQAHGLAFSVPFGEKVPSSLRNIYKELQSDIEGFKAPHHGNLSSWASQGVLLLNTSLTVSAHSPGSHKGFGWEKFTDAVVTVINRDLSGVVFILWGNHAQTKAKNLNLSKHAMLKSVHPSGLSASKGFFGSKPFSKCNQLLVKFGKEPIDWTSICADSAEKNGDSK